MESWRYLVIYSQLIMYNSMLIPKAKNFEDVLQTTTADNRRFEPCNIYHNHNTCHIHIYCWTYLSKINISAVQSDKQTIQAHGFLRKDIIREKVKTHIKGGNKKERHDERHNERHNRRQPKKKITKSHNPRLRHSKEKKKKKTPNSDKWTE